MVEALKQPNIVDYIKAKEVDNELLRGRDPWVPFRGAYVHIVTGEFVPDSIKPDYDSYPCWKLEEPASRYFDPNSAIQVSGKLGAIALILDLIATILNG